MSTTLHPAPAATQPTPLAAELAAIFTGAAFAPLPDTGFLRITGPDATRWLNGMVTNAVAALAPGEGCYNFLLSAQGRILGDCTIYRDPTPDPPAFLLETGASQLDAIQTHLDHFIIMDDVELVPAPSNERTLLMLGPGAPSILRDHFRRGGDPSTMAALRLALNSEFAAQISTPSPSLVPQFEIQGDSDALARFAINKGAALISPAALEALRILSGLPRYGIDIRNTAAAHDLPQETAPIGIQSRALHFSKGCYLGQEIVERIHSRGSVHRTFTGFLLTGSLPAAGAQLTAEPIPAASESKKVGELTSVASIPHPTLPDAPPLLLALGYIRREALPNSSDPNSRLSYPGGTATPVALPFHIPGLP